MGPPDDTSTSYQDRLDRDGTLYQAEQMAALLRNPLVRALFRLSKRSIVGIEDEADLLVSQMHALLDDIDPDARVLGQLGWCMHGGVMVDDYRTAAKLARSGRAVDAENLLVEAWNAPDRLRTLTKRIITLYDPEDPRRHLRWLALDEALQCHEAGFYRGAIGIVLPLIEGLVDDVTPDDAEIRFYRRGTAGRLSDQETLAGHPLSLPVLSQIMGKSQNVTAATGELTRNGILHGKELDYGSLRNSTKAFVALIAAVEWAQPIARSRLEHEARERQRRFAGSDGVDADGRRLDRREFAQVKVLLHTVATYQLGRKKRGRGYTAAVSELGVRDELANDPRLQLRLDDEDDAYFAWFTTVSGWVFGIAGRAASFQSGCSLAALLRQVVFGKTLDGPPPLVTRALWIGRKWSVYKTIETRSDEAAVLVRPSRAGTRISVVRRSGGSVRRGVAGRSRCPVLGGNARSGARNGCRRVRA